jgi:hypothetical protein
MGKSANIQEGSDLTFYECDNSQSDAMRTEALLIVIAGQQIPANKNDLNALISRLTGHPKRAVFVAVFGEHAGEVEGTSLCSEQDILSSGLPTTVCVHASKENVPDPGLPLRLLRLILTLNLHSVRQFHFSGVEWPYKRLPKDKRRILFLFPGPIFPINRGSHQRALNMILALVEKEFDVTAVVASSGNELHEPAIASLSLITSECVHYTNPNVSIGIILAWLIESGIDLVRRIGATKMTSSGTFAQKSLIRNSAALRRCLRQMDLESFDAILVNYAWLLPSILHRRTKRPLLICDTHDVQFLRSFGEDSVELDAIASFLAARTKRQELRLLKASDVVLSISERDHTLLARHLSSEKVILATTGFDYAFAPARRILPSRPLRFGFIGAAMDANEIALDQILNIWWPEVCKWSPESRLFLAGGISSDDSIRRFGFLDDTIVPLGYVPILSEYYNEIDVLLSPVLMAGGINFKNAEAISAGVTLITSPLGASALGNLEGVLTAVTGDDVVRHLRDIETDFDRDVARRQRLQTALLERYDLRPAIDEIIDRLPSGT